MEKSNKSCNVCRVACVPASKQVDVGDLSQRRQLLSDLKCHSFKWFIDNVYKDAPFPNGDLYLGQVSCLRVFEDANPPDRR